MRVVQVVPSLGVGGAERMAALLSTTLASQGHEVVLVSLYDRVGSWIEAEAEASGMPLHFLGKRPGLDPKVVLRLSRLLRSLRPDVVHTHLHGLKYAFPVRPFLGVPFVHTLHNLAAHEVEWHGQALQQLAFRAGVAPVAIGEAVARSVESLYRLSPEAVIPNAVRVSDFQVGHHVRVAARAELGLREQEFVLLAAGRLDAQKNHALLLQALPLGCTLLLAGEGPLRAELERMAPTGVRFLGLRRDMPRLLAAADALVLPSSWEGNPLTVMEAMAAGRAVVATSVGCVPELVDDETGLLVPPGDAPALRAALAALVADVDRARRMGLAGARRAASRWDAPVMAQAYARLYERLVAERL